MNIEETKIKKLFINNVERLDPITVYIEDETRFKITIECYGSSWSAVWGNPSMGCVEFFSSQHYEYLIGYLAPNIQKYEPNYETFKIEMRQKILELRRDECISFDLARELYDIDDWSEHVSDNPYEPIRNLSSHHYDELEDSDFFTFDVPERITSQYRYLTYIVKTVQEALKLNQQPVN